MNDLSAPLGIAIPKASRRRWPIAMIFVAAVSLVVMVAVIWAVMVDDPLGGQPVASARIDRDAARTGGNAVSVVGVRSGSGEDLDAADDIAAAAPPGTAEDDGDDMIAAVDQPGSGAALPTAADARAMPLRALDELVEEGRFGQLPKIGADGTRPLDAYARPVPPIVGASPKIAIIIGGIGLSQSGTQEALRQLPAEVTLAFAPYGNSLDLWQGRARQDGHELLLQLPLEPFDYPDNDPGPHTLLTTLAPEQNSERLDWLMSRLGAYVGVMNYMGARFTADPAAVEPMLRTLKDRGLLYFDDGSSSRSRTLEIGRRLSTPVAGADLVVDALPSDADIDARLAQLEQLARTRGLAVGYASALPVSVRRIAEWTRGLENRGITLVPVTATLAAR
ncbi:divergent polysaccharide deacetylase family protein [Methylobrevis albus]|uniref:Divergent polysaccharide deacetylase family protein n=1 Tax=Methylobrevis albus TaxID=2793297 RepID=A0A931I2I1_9HYPH|nr:divergent polysaccharide deacetylase family protein [Methylobrevis albus]MBH0238066.1 divergent polysaccharide deacetylase family protein [Methylobrevis albus]